MNPSGEVLFQVPRKWISAGNLLGWFPRPVGQLELPEGPGLGTGGAERKVGNPL